MGIIPLQVIGLGSHQGDDQAGWEVVSQLRTNFAGQSPLANLELLTVAHPWDCLHHFQPARPTWIVDACQSDTACDPFWRAVWPCADLPMELSVSTHGGSLRDCLELAMILHRCPSPLVIYAIPGITWEPNPATPTQIHPRITAVVRALEQELRQVMTSGVTLSG